MYKLFYTPNVLNPRNAEFQELSIHTNLEAAVNAMNQEYAPGLYRVMHPQGGYVERRVR